MAAPTAYYVDPAIAGNSGTGTIGDPFGDLQYALNTITRDATNGDIIHIKSGTAEVLAASLTLATYGTPAVSAPLIMRGYTTTANDGGIAEINCNGFTFWTANTYAYYKLVELQIHSFGNNNGVSSSAGAGYAMLYRCNIHKGASSPSGKILVQGYTSRMKIIGCHIHDAGTAGIGVSLGNVDYCYIYNCPTGVQGAYVRNSIICDCTTIGILLNSVSLDAISNSIYSSTAATGKGISATSADAQILNNIIEGYSGVGGIGISATADIQILGYNAFYNCATSESLGDVHIDLGNDATLTASPFTNAASGDFSLLTSVAGAIDGAFPGAWYGTAGTTDHADIGAVQNGDIPDTLQVRAGVG